MAHAYNAPTMQSRLPMLTELLSIQSKDKLFHEETSCDSFCWKRCSTSRDPCNDVLEVCDIDEASQQHTCIASMVPEQAGVRALPCPGSSSMSHAPAMRGARHPLEPTPHLTNRPACTAASAACSASSKPLPFPQTGGRRWECPTRVGHSA